MGGMVAGPIAGMLAFQADADAVGALQRIATAQTVIAVVMVLFGIIALGAAVVMILELRAARKLLHKLGDTLDDLKPRLVPLIDRATSITDDVSAMMDNVRHKVDDVVFTVEEVNRAVRKLSHEAEDRVRRFGAVLDVVQSEAEDLMLDATAAAHGMHETVRQLRGDDEDEELRPRRARRSRRPTPFDDEDIEEMFE